MRKKVMILLIVLLGLAWYQTISAMVAVPVKYKEHIAAAETYAQKEIYEDALAEYEMALAIRPTEEEVKLRIAETQLKLGNKSAFISGCEELINGEPMNEQALQELVYYYAADGKCEKIVDFLKELRGRYPDNENVAELWKKYRGSYEELYYSYELISPFYAGYAITESENGHGMVNVEGENVLGQIYEEVGYYSEEIGCVPVKLAGNWYYVNEKEHKKIVPDEQYDFLGPISGGCAVVSKNGKYAFANMQMEPQTDYIWDAASNLYDGTAAVEKDGKWALLDQNLELQTDYIYEGVAVDEMGFCSRGERVFVKQADGFHLVDGKGTEIASQVFEDAKAFGEEDLTAVCVKGKWGFVNREGEWMIDCQYEDARQFQEGLAPVKADGKWGYINVEGEMVITPVFEDAYPFNEAGTAPVKDGDWLLIHLYALS